MIDLKYVEIINKCQNLNGLILVLKRMMDEESVLTEFRGSFLEDLINQEDIRKTILRLFSKDLIANPLVFNMPEIVKFMEIDKVDGTLTIYAFKIYKIVTALSINNIKRPDYPGLFMYTDSVLFSLISSHHFF